MMSITGKQVQLLKGETSLEDETEKIFDEPFVWMAQEHPLLGGKSPNECVKDGREQAVWDLLRAIKYVGQT